MRRKMAKTDCMWHVWGFATKNRGVIAQLEWHGPNTEAKNVYAWRLDDFCDWVDWLVDQKAELVRKAAEGDCDTCREEDK